MKKKVLLSLLVGTLLFSGCTLGGEEKKTGTEPAPTATIAPEAAKEKVQQSPEELFDTLVQANLGYSIDVLKKNFPSKEAFEKGEKTLSLKATDISLEGTPAQIGKVSFDISTSNIGDFSQIDAVKASQVIDIKASIKEAMVAGDVTGKIELLTVDNSLFASLRSLEMNSPMIPKEEVDAITGPLLGKWFGNTFEELNALQQGANTLDLQKFIAGTPMGVLMWEIIENQQINPKDYIEFISFTEEKDGVFYFETKQKTEKTVQDYEKIFNAIGLQSSVASELLKNTKDLDNEIIVVGFKPSDPSFISVSSPSFNTKTGKKIADKKNTIIFSDSEFFAEVKGEPDTIRIHVKDGKFTIGGDFSEKKDITLISGTYSDSELTFEAGDPQYEETTDKTTDETTGEKSIQKKVSGKFTKTGNIWEGEITNTINPHVVVKISNASYSKEKITISLEIVIGEFTYGPIDFKTTIKEVDSVSIEKPENAQSFEMIQQILAPQAQEVEAVPVEAENAE